MNNLPLKQLTEEEIISLLKRAGLSATSQRVGLCHYILCEAKHPTVDHVKDWAGKAGLKVSLATIYNTMHALCHAGLLKDLRFPHQDKVIYDNNVNPHHHFLDEDTGQIIDISEKDIELYPNLKDNFDIHKVDVLIRGRLKNKGNLCEKS